MRSNADHRANTRIEELLNAPDITAEEAEVLRDKTNRLEDTTEDKLKLNRYYHCLELGVHTLDRQILEDYHFKYRRITNFCALIDAKNLRYTDDNQHDDLVAKLPVVRELITALGYENMFDRSTSIDRDAFTDKINSMKAHAFSRTTSSIVGCLAPRRKHCGSYSMRKLP